MGQERDGSPFAHKPKVPIVMSTPQNLEVLYEDNHIIAVNKRSSDIVQGDITNDRTLDNVIREYLRVKYDKPGEAWLGTIHRIDRPVSGVILYAKTSKCLSRMMKAFKHREVAKTYWAVVKGEPPQSVGHVVNYLRKNSERNKSYAYDSPGKDRKESGVNEQAQQRKEEMMGFAVVGLLMLLALAGIWATANPSMPALTGGEGSKPKARR